MFRSVRSLCLFGIVIATLLSITISGSTTVERVPDPERGNRAVQLSIDGTINPAVGDYIKKGIQTAVEQHATLVIIQMNTPGGLDASMRDIIHQILASQIPVVTYVAPDGARAASAGTYILYASHIAAMAPATNLGAATPIQIGGMGGAQEEQKEKDERSKPDVSALEKKIIKDASAYIKALADKHGRNAEWAVLAVQEAETLTATEALALNVINIVAENRDDLLHQLDGAEVTVAGELVQVATEDIVVDRFDPSWRYKLLGVISDPTIAYFLLLLGFYGLIYELANPGFLLPGVAGGISLMLAFYAFQLLPVNYSGLALMFLGGAFLIGEAFLPSFGTLGIGGIVAFSIGSLILIDDEMLRISLPVILGTAAVSACFIFILVGRVSLMRKKPVHTGVEAMVGMRGVAKSDITESGTVWVNGESWNAQSRLRVKKGDEVRVLSISGLRLQVEPLSKEH